MEDPEALDGRLDPLADMLYSTKYSESAGDVIVANREPRNVIYQ